MQVRSTNQHEVIEYFHESIDPCHRHALSSELISNSNKSFHQFISTTIIGTYRSLKGLQSCLASYSPGDFQESSGTVLHLRPSEHSLHPPKCLPHSIQTPSPRSLKRRRRSLARKGLSRKDRLLRYDSDATQPILLKFYTRRFIVPFLIKPLSSALIVTCANSFTGTAPRWGAARKQPDLRHHERRAEDHWRKGHRPRWSGRLSAEHGH